MKTLDKWLLMNSDPNVTVPTVTTEDLSQEKLLALTRMKNKMGSRLPTIKQDQFSDAGLHNRNSEIIDNAFGSIFDNNVKTSGQLSSFKSSLEDVLSEMDSENPLSNRGTSMRILQKMSLTDKLRELLGMSSYSKPNETFDFVETNKAGKDRPEKVISDLINGKESNILSEMRDSGEVYPQTDLKGVSSIDDLKKIRQLLIDRSIGR